MKYFAWIAPVVIGACLANPHICMGQTQPAHAVYQMGWDNYKPSEPFVKSAKQIIDKGYIPKDSLNVITVYNSIDSSDVGSTLLSSNPQFRKVTKVWSFIIKDTVPLVFPTNMGTRKHAVNPFVGIEEWVFSNDDDAIKCMDMLRLGMIGTYRFNIHRPPREFARTGSHIYYFYTFPSDFYASLVKVRDIFLKNLTNPDIVK